MTMNFTVASVNFVNHDFALEHKVQMTTKFFNQEFATNTESQNLDENHGGYREFRRSCFRII